MGCVHMVDEQINTIHWMLNKNISMKLKNIYIADEQINMIYIVINKDI